MTGSGRARGGGREIEGGRTHRVLDVPLLRVVRDVLVELALQVFLLLLVQLVLLV